MKQNLYQQPNLSTNYFFVVSSIIIVAILVLSCNQQKEVVSNQTIEEIRVVPTPSKILYKRSRFKLEKSTRVLLNLSDEKSKKAADDLIKLIHSKTGYKLKISDRFTTNKVANAIEIIIKENGDIKTEGFKINISSNRIKIFSNDSNSMFYASNVILGLLAKTNNNWSAPQVIIEDYASTKLRGVYLTTNDSTINKPNLLELLKLNRINYLISSGEWTESSNSILHIGDTSELPSNWKLSLIEEENIKKYYLSRNEIKEAAIFKISNKALLHPDSLSILGEAMWSQPTNLNYQKLLNHLESKSIH